MRSGTIEVTYENDDGEEINLVLPAKNEVCSDCGGDGKVLCDGMRGHAYTSEEFAESFDDEEAEEYFKVGGRYDVECQTCQGRNVVAVVDEEHIPEDQKAAYALYVRYDRQRAEGEADDRATERAERRMGC